MQNLELHRMRRNEFNSDAAIKRYTLKNKFNAYTATNLPIQIKRYRSDLNLKVGIISSGFKYSTDSCVEFTKIT